MNIILIGMMGAGKSLVGNRLAGKISKDFYDLDHWIEKRHNSKIPKIFENNGEEYFRKIEAECFSEIIATDNEKVISTGGGTPLNSGCKKHFFGNEVIFLDAYPDILFQRASKRKDDRPLLKNLNYKEFEHLYNERRKIYSSISNLTLDTSNKDIRETVKKIMEYYEF